MDQNQNTQTPPQASAPSASSEVANDKVMAILSYLGILILIPLLATKNRSAFLNYHINQGLGLIIVCLIGWFVLSLFSWYFWYLRSIWQLLMLILVIIGIVHAAKNEMRPLPVIGNWFHLIK